MKPDITQNAFQKTSLTQSSSFSSKMQLGIRALVASSLHDPTISGMKQTKKHSFHEMDTVDAFNRHTQQQFQSILEITQHLDNLMQKKLLTE